MNSASLRITFALLAAAAASATIFVAVDVILLLLSPAEADSVAFALSTVGFLWPITFGIALAHAVVLGLPAYLVLSRLRFIAWWIAPIGGFAVGSLPYGVLAFPWTAPPPDLLEAHIIARFTWLHYVGMIAGLGGLGAVGGVAAWLVRYRLGQRRTAALVD